MTSHRHRTVTRLAILLVMASCMTAQAQTATTTSAKPASALDDIFPKDQRNVGGTCRPDQRFFLRGKIGGQSLFFCDVSGGGGASLSYTRNSVANSTDINAKAGFGVRLGSKLSFGNHTRAGFIGYAEIDSQNKSTGQDQSQLRLGIDGNFITDFGNARATDATAGSLIYAIGAYYLTDVDFEASGYGVSASAYPEIPGLRVNFKKPGQNFHWDFSTSLDLLKVSDAGSTGLAADTDYAWATFSLKGIYKAKPKAFSNGIEINFGSEYAKDMVAGEELHQLSAGAKVFLDKDQQVALSLDYSRGETRSSPTYAETTMLNLEFKF